MPFELVAADEAYPTVRDIAREALEEGLDEGDTLVRMRAAVRTPEDLARWLAAQVAADGCEILAAAHLDPKSELGDLVDHLDVQLNEGWAHLAALTAAVREAAAAAGLPLVITTERERVVTLEVRELVMALGEAARLGREEEVEVAQAQGRLARWRVAQHEIGRHVQRVRHAIEGVELVEGDGLLSLDILRDMITVGQAAQQQPGEASTDPAPAGGAIPEWTQADSDLYETVARQAEADGVIAAVEWLQAEADRRTALGELGAATLGYTWATRLTELAAQREASTDPAPADGEAAGGLAVLRPQVQPAVVRMARDLLRRARQGEVQGLAVVIAGPDRSASTAFELGDGGVTALGFGAFDLACRIRGEG